MIDATIYLYICANNALFEVCSWLLASEVVPLSQINTYHLSIISILTDPWTSDRNGEMVAFLDC